MADTVTQQVDLAQFNRLIHDLIHGGMKRNTFQTWELDLMLDLESCRIRNAARDEVLRRYQRAVQKRFAAGVLEMLTVSAFVAAERAHRRRPKAAPEP